jgi:hypothetical protein
MESWEGSPLSIFKTARHFAKRHPFSLKVLAPRCEFVETSCSGLTLGAIKDDDKSHVELDACMDATATEMRNQGVSLGGDLLDGLFDVDDTSDIFLDIGNGETEVTITGLNIHCHRASTLHPRRAISCPSKCLHTWLHLN